MRILEREAIFIRKEDIRPSVRKELIEDYTFRFYNDKACQRCEHLLERHSDLCDGCQAFNGGVALASQHKVRGKSYLKFPAGIRPQLVAKLRQKGIKGKIRVIKKQVTPEQAPFRRKIKFAYSKLHGYQKLAVSELLKKKKGVLKSAPRTGKTVMSAAFMCKVQGKALVLASQRTWLVGFYETFCGSSTQKRFTNARGSGVSTQEISAWRKAGRPFRNIGFCKTIEDFKAHDICLVTYQTFLSDKGQELLRKLRNEFAVLVIDEVHTGAADRYAEVISRLNCEYKIGLSGTPERKDQRYVLMDNLVGPKLHETKVEQLRPRIALTKTKFKYSAKMARWDQMVTSLENNKPRQNLIADQALKDVENGHMVLIPLLRVKAVDNLVDVINKKAGKKIAYAFHGSISKDQQTKIVDAARKYKVKVIVGNAKMISTGINIPRASMLYEAFLSSNIPNAEQRFKRVLTPWDDKPAPTVRFFLDDMAVRRSCMRNEFWRALIPRCNPIISDRDREIIKQYFDTRKTYGKIEL